MSHEADVNLENLPPDLDGGREGPYMHEFTRIAIMSCLTKPEMTPCCSNLEFFWKIFLDENERKRNASK